MNELLKIYEGRPRAWTVELPGLFSRRVRVFSEPPEVLDGCLVFPGRAGFSPGSWRVFWSEDEAPVRVGCVRRRSEKVGVPADGMARLKD